MDWREMAACRNTEADLHFPVGVTGPAVVQARAAKQVCAGCPVTEQCRDYALSRQAPPITAGIWGGLWFDAGEARAYRARVAS